MAREMTGVGVKPSCCLNDGLDAVGREHFQGRPLGGAGEGVRVLAHEQRAGRSAWLCAIVADGLRDGQDVGLGERAVQRRAAMAAGAEADELLRIVQIRLPLVIGALQLSRFDQQFMRRGFAGQGMQSHGRIVPCSVSEAIDGGSLPQARHSAGS